jgi:hypothetical protein
VFNADTTEAEVHATAWEIVESFAAFCESMQTNWLKFITRFLCSHETILQQKRSDDFLRYRLNFSFHNTY